MVTPVQAGNGQVSGAMLFYERPEPLNSEIHGRLGLRRIDRPFAFCATTQAVPLTVAEFPLASLSFPVIFGGENYQPIGVMGINADVNMFVKPDGYFEPGIYVPAYVRRYPFALANDESRGQMVVCVDRDAAMLGDLPDLPFFDPAGQPTDYTKGCIQFCNDYQQEIQRTSSFVALLRELDLFETRKATYAPVNVDGTPGRTQEIAEYFAVSETKLKALPEKKILELFQNGALGQIHAHLISLGGWDRMIALALARQAGAPAAANLN